MKASNNRTRARRMVFHHLFLSLLCGASVLLAACGGGGGGGGGSSGDGGGGGGTPAGTKLYYGYYVEDPANNPEDPTTGGLFIRVPTGDASFAGQMPFSFIGCTEGTDIGAVSGNRVADTLSGNWSGTMDNTAVGGSFIGSYTLATDSFAGTYGNAAGKIQISVGDCQYFVAANGTFKLFGTPTSEPSNFQAAATAGTTPTISWPSLGANVTYAVRVYDEDCLNNNLSDPACFQGETFTTALSAAYPTAFAGSSALIAGKNYFVLVTAQDLTNGSFLGFSMLRIQPGASGGGGNLTVSQLAAGFASSCALSSSGSLKCWGELGGLVALYYPGSSPNTMGNNLPSMNFGNGRTVRQVALGMGHGCVILDTGSVKCWGTNIAGELGFGNTTPQFQGMGSSAYPGGDALPVVDLGTGRTAKQITVGQSHTCAILDNDSVKCWGSNSSGRLGLGDMNNRGDNPGEMGDNLPTVDLGTGRTARQITAGQNHTCALLDNGSVKCWGRGTSLGLGVGGTNLGDGANEMGDNLPAVNLGTGRTIVKVVAGQSHNCALLDNNQLKCWGVNGSGDLGLGNTSSPGMLSLSNMGDNLPAVDLGTGHTAKQIAAGAVHTCAILDNGSVKCWGNGAALGLGLDATYMIGIAANQMGDNLPTADLGAGRTASQLVAHYGHTCAALDNGSMKCWGSNISGQLGLGDTNARGDNFGEMGDNLPAVDLGN